MAQARTRGRLRNRTSTHRLWEGCHVDPTRLLEREHELAVLDDAIERLGRGEGGTVVFEGIAGIGKTALLAQACGRAQDAGFAVLTASGGELERDFPYCLVRQLFESVVHRLA